MSKWLFLRGKFDERTENSIDTMDDVWLELFMELAKGECDMCDIIFKNNSGKAGYCCTYSKVNIEHEGNKGSRPAISAFDDISSLKNIGMVKSGYDFIFARGGFDYYLPILREHKNAFKVRYGAGRRYMPEKDIKYDLVLVDSEKQKQDVLSAFPHANVHLWIKPAAKHFKYMPEVEKEFDVCYIANGQQAHFKGVEWVYETCPKDLKILHLGYDSKYTVPENVTQIRVDRIDMPKWINKCKVGIVPYFNDIDSCPRVIPEMIACGLPMVIADQLNYQDNRYLGINIGQTFFWEAVGSQKNIYCKTKDVYGRVNNFYKKNLSLQVSANHIRKLIDEAR